MNNNQSFSERHGFRQVNEAEITIRFDAPHELRGVLIDLAYKCRFTPKTLRTIVCRTFRKRPDENNWSNCNIEDEIRRLIDQEDWFKVYDLIEEISNSINKMSFSDDPELFQREINEYFIEKGIGWKLVDGMIEARNPAPFEQYVRTATKELKKAKMKTAQSEIQEALDDLSRRPDPDITGSVQHAMTALECVMRKVTGNERSTLGELLKQYPDMCPPPLNEALKKLWGFASEYGRHIREGRNPVFSEAQLVLGICTSVITYLIEQHHKGEQFA